jgi:hypothetical protein
MQHLQVATQPRTGVVLSNQRDPKALLQQATGKAATKFDRIKAVFQKLDAPDRIRNLGDGLPLSQVGIDLPDLEPEGKPSQQIEPNSVRSLQPIYLVETLQDMRAPKVADRPVELFQDGFLSIATQGSGSVPERNSFFTGRLLAENDLQDEQQSQRNESIVGVDDFNEVIRRGQVAPAGQVNSGGDWRSHSVVDHLTLLG